MHGVSFMRVFSNQTLTWGNLLMNKNVSMSWWSGERKSLSTYRGQEERSLESEYTDCVVCAIRSGIILHRFWWEYCRCFLLCNADSVNIHSAQMVVDNTQPTQSCGKISHISSIFEDGWEDNGGNKYQRGDQGLICYQLNIVFALKKSAERYLYKSR